MSLGAALFVYGAFASLPSPAIAAYIADVVPAERQQRAYVLQSWAINFGYAIGPIVANQLVKISYSLMFYVEAAVMIAVTILLIAFFREVRHLGITVSVPSAVRHEDECSVTHAEFAGIERPNHSDAAPAASVKGAMSRNWRRVLTDTPFLGFSLLMFGYFLVYFQSTSGLPIAMTDLGLGLGEYSVLLTINGGMLCLLQIPAMKLFARMGNSRVLVMGLAVTVIGYAVRIRAQQTATERPRVSPGAVLPVQSAHTERIIGKSAINENNERQRVGVSTIPASALEQTRHRAVVHCRSGAGGRRYCGRHCVGRPTWHYRSATSPDSSTQSSSQSTDKADGGHSSNGQEPTMPMARAE